MRVTTAFNKILSIPSAMVASVEFTEEGVVVGLRRRRGRPRCPCGWRATGSYDSSVRRWRHLDLGSSRLWLQAEIRRLDCRRCGRVRTEDVGWARPRARHSRDFEDVVAWLAQRTDKTTITRLLRTSWETVAGIVERVVAEQVDARWLTGLLRLGVDEVSYRKGHRYLTVVADHDQSGRVVWAAEGKNAATLGGVLRRARRRGLRGAGGCQHGPGCRVQEGHRCQGTPGPAVRGPVSSGRVSQRGHQQSRRWAWNLERDKARAAAAVAGPKRRGRPPAGSPPPARDQARWVKHTRWALLRDPDALKPSQLDVLHELRRSGSVLYRCWQLKEGLRDLFRLADPADAPEHLDWWLGWACRSRIPAFVTLSKTVRANRERVLAAIELGLSNSKLEGLNSKIRLINHRGYGHHSAAALIAMIYLCCGGISITLPLH